MKTLTINGKDYQLTLTTRNCVELEQKLGCNPLQVIYQLADEQIPTITQIALILHGMLQKYNHGISINDTYDLIDDYMDEGNTPFSLIAVFMEVLRECGYIAEPKEIDNEEESKN